MPRRSPPPVEPSSSWACEPCQTAPLGFADLRAHLLTAHGIPLDEQVATTKEMVMHMDAARFHASTFKHTFTRDGRTIELYNYRTEPRGRSG